MNEYLKDYCWNLRLDHVFNEKLSPFVLPSLKQATEFLGLSLRYKKYHFITFLALNNSYKIVKK